MAERSLAAAFRTENQLNNRLARRLYLKKANVRNPPSKTKNQSQQRLYSLRAISPPIEHSKLNLSALLDEAVVDIHQHPIYPIAAKLIRLLYEGTSLIPEKAAPNWETTLLDAMIAKGKQRKEREHLADLFPDDPSLQSLFYKMAKGTNQYKLSGKKQGIPPLGQFLSVKPEKKEQTFHFCFASVPLLQAAFGLKIAEAIVLKERERQETENKLYFSSKEDLQEQLMQDPTLANLLAALEPYLSFDKLLPRKEQIAGKDPVTGLVITREIL